MSPTSTCVVQSNAVAGNVAVGLRMRAVVESPRMTELNGILPVDKPEGPTSHDIVARAVSGPGPGRIRRFALQSTALDHAPLSEKLKPPIAGFKVGDAVVFRFHARCLRDMAGKCDRWKHRRDRLGEPPRDAQQGDRGGRDGRCDAGGERKAEIPQPPQAGGWGRGAATTTGSSPPSIPSRTGRAPAAPTVHRRRCPAQNPAMLQNATSSRVTQTQPLSPPVGSSASASRSLSK